MSTPWWYKKQRLAKEYAEHLKDPRWIAKRDQIKARDNHRCVDCGSTEALTVHHLRYNGMPWEVEDSDLVTLCQPCHDSRHGSNKREFVGAFTIGYPITRKLATIKSGSACRLLAFFEGMVKRQNLFILDKKAVMRRSGMANATFHKHLKILMDLGLVLPEDGQLVQDVLTAETLPKYWRICPFLAWKGSTMARADYVITLGPNHVFWQYVTEDIKAEFMEVAGAA